MDFYLPILLEEIDLVDPDVIVTLGNMLLRLPAMLLLFVAEAGVVAGPEHRRCWRRSAECSVCDVAYPLSLSPSLWKFSKAPVKTCLSTALLVFPKYSSCR